MPLLVDTGVLYALADRDDAWHTRVREFLEVGAEPLLVPATVLPEVAYLLATRLGADAERAFVRSIAEGELAVQELTRRDYERVAAVLDANPSIGLVDASIVVLAERLKVARIATTDRRQFSAIKWTHARQVVLVP